MSNATQIINLTRFFDERPYDKASKAAASSGDNKGTAALNGKSDFARLMSDLNKQPLDEDTLQLAIGDDLKKDSLSSITKSLSEPSQAAEKSDQWLSDMKHHQGNLKALLKNQDVLSKLFDLAIQDGQGLSLEAQELAQLKELADFLASRDNQSFLSEINAKLEQLFAQIEQFTQQGAGSELSADQLAVLDELLQDLESKLEQFNLDTDSRVLPEALMPLLSGVERLAELRTAKMAPANARPTVVDVLRALNQAAPNAAEMRSGQSLEGLERTGLRELFSLGGNAQNATNPQANNSIAQIPVAQLLNERGFSTGLTWPSEMAKEADADALKRGERNPFNLTGSTLNAGVFGNNPTTAMPQAASGNPQTNPQAASQMAQQIQWMVSKGVSRANIELRPADLGSIRISIQTRGEETRIMMSATQQNTQSMLEQQLPRLREWLQEAGLSGAQVDVHSGNEES
ncbi:MAG TPA: flagellar hook-length control protein FliK, partial [Halothiobacillaceae bacterium]|nr:flagellar hook-length control protein FliK [Halothiobacillaceae bacterium]